MTQIFYREERRAVVGLFASGKIKEALKGVRISPCQLIMGKYTNVKFRHKILDARFYVILN